MQYYCHHYNLQIPTVDVITGCLTETEKKDRAEKGQGRAVTYVLITLLNGPVPSAIFHICT